MFDEEILRKAIKKAFKNGYVGSWGGTTAIACEAHSAESEGACIFSTIFSHDFAKAFWGEELKCNWCDIKQEKHTVIKSGSGYHECSECGLMVEGAYAQPSWRNHLQQIVLKEDPIKYLNKFI